MVPLCIDCALVVCIVGEYFIQIELYKNLICKYQDVLKMPLIYVYSSHLTGHWSLLLKNQDTWYIGNDADNFIVASEDLVAKCEMFMYTKAEQIDVSWASEKHLQFHFCNKNGNVLLSLVGTQCGCHGHQHGC